MKNVFYVHYVKQIDYQHATKLLFRGSPVACKKNILICIFLGVETTKCIRRGPHLSDPQASILQSTEKTNNLNSLQIVPVRFSANLFR